MGGALFLAAAVPLWWFARSGSGSPTSADRRRSASRRPGGVVARAGELLWPVLPTSLQDGLSRRCALAGEPDAHRTLGSKVLAAAAALVLVAATVARGASPGGLLFSLLALASAWNLPDMRLVSRGRERQDALRRTLADTIDQVALCMQAGLGFDAALGRVASVGSGPLPEELSRVLNDVSLGMPRPLALDRLLDRTDVPELRQLVAAVNQADRYGVSVADTLRLQSSELREKRRQWAEEQATKVPVKLLFPLVFCIMPSLFVVLLGPAAVRIGAGGLGG